MMKEIKKKAKEARYINKKLEAMKWVNQSKQE